MTLILRYMQNPDIPQVVTIDHLAFTPPWSARSYAYEVNESNYSHMLVLEHFDVPPPPSGIKRLVQSINGGREIESRIVGYGGLWYIMDEAHISTIAIHPELRGRGWGEILLAGMIRRSITLGAHYIVLEVRVSNTVAQQLYQKYDFKTVAIKRKYYHNDGEDAYDMRLNLDDGGEYARSFAPRYAHLLETHGFTDLYTETLPPRNRSQSDSSSA
ncbi:MAG: ribosomal protein S18-alanine N-acetyltransferase [Chloroflexi bacterium]|nr:ribosomal protein S18-alanine N-acetyltransferase [Chloroflexota bacterium]